LVYSWSILTQLERTRWRRTFKEEEKKTRLNYYTNKIEKNFEKTKDKPCSGQKKKTKSYKQDEHVIEKKN
jgi:hypothetical protein